VAWHPASPTPGMRASVDDPCIARIAAPTPAGGSANPGTWSHSHASFAALEAAARCSAGRSTAGWGACARRENLVVCGPSGTGKTFLLEALGQQAAGAGRRRGPLPPGQTSGDSVRLSPALAGQGVRPLT
jgi:hypothetical protein